MLDSIWFVSLNTDNGLLDIERTHQQLDTDDDLLALLQNELVVASEIWLTLYTIHDEHLRGLAWRRHEFHVGWETCATQTYDTCLLHLINDGFWFVV